ncbi:Evolutionarily conserved signaling intermediate in Toll pathway, mitochondrial [Trichinella sp. T8]|nr:Evolutionarily conserved signaling intermediate in Toll pathway, mitochondrial [Trichinella sp. T8]
MIQKHLKLAFHNMKLRLFRIMNWLKNAFYSKNLLTPIPLSIGSAHVYWLNSTIRCKSSAESQTSQTTKALTVVDEVFDTIPPEDRNKKTFEKALGMYLRTNVTRRGHTEFIYAALKRMKEFGVHKDLESYKRLLEIFPKGKMIPRNFMQVEGMHYPKQQQCCIDVLDEMEWWRVYPDKEIYLIVKNAFGEWTHAMRKMKRQMYWMPKFKNADPYPLPRPVPNSDIEIAQAAMRRICRDPANNVEVFYTSTISDSTINTWIVSGQSPHQREHIEDHPTNEALYVDGPFRTWLADKSLFYFTLISEPNKKKYFSDFQSIESLTSDEWYYWKTKYNSPISDNRSQLMTVPTIHEQKDGTILALAITGNSSKDSLACWLKFLEKFNSKLKEIPVVFRLQHAECSIAEMEEESRLEKKENPNSTA